MKVFVLEIQCFDVSYPSLEQELGRNYEIKNVPGSVSVKGRLKKSLNQWQEIGSSVCSGTY